MSRAGEVRKIVSGSFLSVGLSYFTRAANMVATVLLTRLLLPEDFGYLALATSYFMFFASLKDFGLHFALLHYRDRAEEMASTHLLLNTGLSGVGMGLVIVVALLFRGYHPSQVTSTLIIFATFTLLRSATYTPETLLRKDFEFGRLALIQTATVLVSLSAALLLVWLGGGFWSLVVGYSPHSITYILTFSLLVWASRPLRLRNLRFRPDLARLLFSYGTWYWLGGIINVLLIQYDKFVVGTLQGATALGFYERAYTFAQMPTGAVTHMLIGITGSVYARYQHDTQKLSAAFSKVFGIILRGSSPIALILFVQAEGLTRLLLGERWLGLAPVLRWLVAYAFLRPMQDDVNSLLLSIGQPRKITQFGAIQAAVFLILTPILTYAFGLRGTAISVGVMVAVGVGLSLGYARHHVDVPWKRMALPPLVSILIAGAACPFIVRLSPFEPSWANLVMEVALMATVYAAALFAIEGRRLVRECRQLYALFRNREDIQAV